MTEMYFCLLRMGISEESIWKLRSLPCAIWFLWNLSRIFNGMPHCSIIPLIRGRENGSAMACVNLWLKTLRLSLSCRHPHPFLHPFPPSLCSHPLQPPFSPSPSPLLHLVTHPSHSLPLLSFPSIPTLSISSSLLYLIATHTGPYGLSFFSTQVAVYKHCDRLSAPFNERI